MAASFEELSEYFEAKISKVKKCLELRGLDASSDTIEALQSIDSDVTDIEEALKEYKEYISSQNEVLQKVESFKDVLDVYDKEVNHVENNLPEHLPGRPSTGGTSRVLKENNKSGTEPSAGKKVNKTGASYQKISYLTTDEFETLPKYLKGRLTYQQVNSAIDQIHKVLAAKYKILSLSRAGMSETNMRKYRSFKEQESAETKGWYFFIDKDLKEYSSFKLDKSGQSILSMLRHCGRLKEMRTGKLVRFLVQP